jgi:hypothetical protein
MLNRVVGCDLKTGKDFVDARKALYSGGGIKNPPTEDGDLLLALKAAVFGKFVVGRHLARHTELIGTQNIVFRVHGVTTELKEIFPAWIVVETAVMQFRGHWICDGLVNRFNMHIGPGMRRDYMELLRTPTKAGAAAVADSRKPRGFTAKQGQYLAFIYYYTKINRQPPAEADFVRYFRVSAPSVHQMIVTLDEHGLIERTAGKSRSITLAIPKEELPALE